MKKSIKHLLFLLLVVTAVCCLLAVVTSAAETTVTTDAELRSAVSGAANGDVIIVANDITLSANMAATKRITIKGPATGNAVTVSRADLVLSIGTGGDVTLGSNLILLGTGSTQTIQSNGGSSAPKLTIDGAIVRHTTNNAYTLNMYGNNVVVTLKSGAIESTSTNNGQAVVGFQSSTNPKFVMTGGSVTATAAVSSKASGISFTNSASNPSCDITGGTIAGGYAGVRFVQPAAEAKFGGTVTITATERSPIHSDFSGDGVKVSHYIFTGGTYTSSTGFATVRLTSSGANGTYYTLHISGGTFNGTGSGHLFSVQGNATITEGVISGGTFNAPANCRALDLTSGLVAAQDLTITGGTFDGGAYGIYFGSTGASTVKVYGGTFRNYTWASIGIQKSGSTLVMGAPANYTPVSSPIQHNAVAALNLAGNVAYTLYSSNTVTFTNNTGMIATMDGNNCVLSVAPSYVCTLYNALGTKVDDYETVAAAVTAASTGYTIEITEDVELASNISFSGKALTFRGPAEGEAVTLSRAGLVISMGSNTTLTLGANLIVAGTGSTQTMQVNGSSTNVTINVAGATVSSSANRTIAIYGSNNTLNLTSGTISSSSTNSGHAAVYFTSGTNATLNVSGGTITTTGCYAVHFNDGVTGSATISSGTIAAGYQGIHSNNAALAFSMTGGNITAARYVLYVGGANSSIAISGGTLASEGAKNGNGLAECAVLNIAAACTDLTVENASITGQFMSLNANVTNPIIIRGVTFRTLDLQSPANGTTDNLRGMYVGSAVTALAMEWGEGNDFVSNNMLLRVEASGIDMTLTVSGGTYRSTNNAIYMNTGTTFAFKMTGGTIVQTDAETLLNLRGTNTNTITITGGTLSNIDTGKAVEVRNGTNGHTITIAGNAVINTMTGFAVSDKSGKTSGTVTLTIGGNANITSASGTAISFANTAANIAVIGGAVTGRTAAFEVGAGNEINIDGGVLTASNASGVVFNNAAGGTVNFNGGFIAKGGSTYLTGETYPDETKVYTKNVMKMAAGAEVRMNAAHPGIRFNTSIDADTVAYINSIADADTVKYYTIIFPADQLSKLSKVTADEIMAKLIITRQYVKILADNGLISDGAGGYYVKASLIDIQSKNYGRNFCSLAFAEFKVGGVTRTQSAYFNETDNSRNIAAVATATLADTSYDYTETELAILNTFAGNEVAMFVAPVAVDTKKYSI